MKQTPIQKAIEYCPDECVAMLNYLQSLLAEERQMVEDAYNQGYREGEEDAMGEMPKIKDVSEFTNASNYFTQTYQQ